jgi:hypothetical protein
MIKVKAATRHALLSLLLLAIAADAYGDCGRSGHAGGTDAVSLSRARAVLESNGIAVEKDYRAMRLVAYSSGGGMVWVRRLYRGLPVFRDELAFHFDSQGRFKRDRAGKPFLGGDAEDISRLDLDPVPGIDSDAAKKAFAQRAKVIQLTGPTGRPAGTKPGPDYSQRLAELETELGIYQSKLAWQICPRGRSHPYGYISADTGSVLYFDSGIRP